MSSATVAAGSDGPAVQGLMTRLSSFDLQALLECAHGRLFGPGNPQLPLPPMLMFHRISHISNEGGAHGKG